MNKILTLLFGAALALAAPQQVIRTNVDLVSLNVTVSEGDHFVGGLEQPKFSVFEDGVKQDISFFTSERQPIARSAAPVP